MEVMSLGTQTSSLSQEPWLITRTVVPTFLKVGVIVIGLASIIIGEVLYATNLTPVGTFDCHLYWFNPLSVAYGDGYCSWFLTQASNSLVQLFWLFVDFILHESCFKGWPYHNDSYCELKDGLLLDHVNLTIRGRWLYLPFLVEMVPENQPSSTSLQGCTHVDQWSDFIMGEDVTALPLLKRAEPPLTSLPRS